MKAHISAWSDALRSSLWFVPTLMVIGAVGLAFLMPQLDRGALGSQDGSLKWLWGGGLESTRGVLTVLAGSIITVASVTYSITITALTLASAQYGPRLLRSFMKDKANQIVLGSFIATFLYCVLILRVVVESPEGPFIPHLSVAMALLLAVLNLGLLIFFIHHASNSIRVEELVASVAREFFQTIDELYPEEVGEGAAPTEPFQSEFKTSHGFEEGGCEVASAEDGYIQAIETDLLMQQAVENDLVLWLKRRPGDFVAQGTTLLVVNPPGTPEQRRVLRDTFVMGINRTPIQDPEFCINQLVEVAVRALSPGINDPFTAISCINWLGAGLMRLAGRKIPSDFRQDSQGKVRMIAHGSTFPGMSDAAFHQIRQYGAKSVAVCIHLLETLTNIAGNIRREEDRESLLRHADQIFQDAQKAIGSRNDLAAVEARYLRLKKALSCPDSQCDSHQQSTCHGGRRTT